jgi:hypothetical protein
VCRAAKDAAEEEGTGARGETPEELGVLEARGEGSSDFFARDELSLAEEGAAAAGAEADEDEGGAAAESFDSACCDSSAGEKIFKTFFFLFMWLNTFSAAFSVGMTGG